MKNAGKACNNRLYRHIRTFEKIVKNYFVISTEICTQYLWKLLIEEKMPIEFTSLGRWSGNDPRKKAQTEIDIMGEQNSTSAIFAECKWRNENVDLDVLETLVDRSGLFHYTKLHYFLFSKTGFTKGCMDKAEEMGNITLISYKDIVKEEGFYDKRRY